jgi:hypothetical protein
MKYFTILTLLLFTFKAYSQTKEKILPPEILYYLTDKDSVRDVVFKYDKHRDESYGFDKNSKPTTLSNAELSKIHLLIKNRVALYNSNKDPKNKYEFIRKPEKYYKQLIPAVNSKGEKEVWIACHCSVIKGYWDKHIGVVNDGGTCEFTLKINLTKGTILTFNVAGLG